MKNVVILGSTGSIGTQTLNVLRRNKDKFNVLALAANENAELISRQANEFCPKYVGMVNCDKISSLKINYDCTVCGGEKVLSDFASLEDADIVVCAVTGMSAFSGVISAIKHGKDIALASKEVLVAGGEYVMALAKAHNTAILPVDSEHSAVWQCIGQCDKSSVRKIILTASGGPFFGARSIEELYDVSPLAAVSHPNWSMGKKISVDSATMMNKGLEIIEARYLFDTQAIDYMIHPQSIIHSMVQFVDGSTLAQMSAPTMELPIQVALFYPERVAHSGYEFGFDKQLTFSAPNEVVFKLPALAKRSLIIGKSAPCVLNAANEAAVELFLKEKIRFTDIQVVVENIMSTTEFFSLNSADDIISSHNEIYNKVLIDYKALI